MASKYLILSYEFYDSNLSVRQFCQLKNISYKLFRNYYYYFAPKRGHVFNHAARKERIAALDKYKMKPQLDNNALVEFFEGWLKCHIVTALDLRVSPFDHIYYNLLLEFTTILKKYKLV